MIVNSTTPMYEQKLFVASTCCFQIKSKKKNRCGEEPDKTDYFSCDLKHEAEPPVSSNNRRKLTRFHKLLGIAVVGLAFPLSSAVHCHVIKSTTISLCMLMWAPCQNRLPFFLPARSFFRPIMPCRENISHLFENPWRGHMLRSLYYTAISVLILFSFYIVYIYTYSCTYIHILYISIYTFWSNHTENHKLNQKIDLLTEKICFKNNNLFGHHHEFP